MSEKRTQGVWWRRQYMGLYAPDAGARARWNNPCRRMANSFAARINGVGSERLAALALAAESGCLHMCYRNLDNAIFAA